MTTNGNDDMNDSNDPNDIIHPNDNGERAVIPAHVGEALVDTTVTAAPAGLFDRLAATAELARPARRPVPLGENAAEPADAYEQTAAELLALLRELTPAEWAATTATAYGSVRDLVAHLAASEDYCTRALQRQPVTDAAFDFDHVACTREVAASLASATTDELTDAWFALANTFLTACRNDPAHDEVSLHQLSVTVSGALVLRTFELWAHTEDICAAIGRPLPRLDAPRLAVMSSRLVGAISGWALGSKASPAATGRLVLLGPGGGVAELGAPRGEDAAPDVRIVADVVDYCRVASRRIAADDLPCSIEGDESLIPGLLNATAMFAKD